MGFVDRLRMNGIYGNSLQPPDLNMGSDISGMLSQILPYLNQRRQDEYNETHNTLTTKPRLQDIGQSVVSPSTPKMSPGFMVDGMTPFEHASLEQRKKEFESKNALGKDTLDIKKGDIAADNLLNKEKLEVTKDKNQLDAENKAKRTAIYDFKAKNPGMKFIPTKGGNYFFADPITGDMHDTGISSGTLTREDEIELQGEQRINAIKETGMNQRENIALQGQNQLANIGANIAGRKDIVNQTGQNNLAAIAARAAETRATNEAKPRTQFKTELPTQTKTRQINTARELMNTRPELAPFIKFDQDGALSIVAPNPSAWSDAGKGPTRAQFDEINKVIYGKTEVPTYKTQDKIPPKSDKVDDDDKIVVEKDGKKSYLPKSQLAEAIKQGYKEVKK